MTAVFNDPVSKERTKCAVKRINLDKNATILQNIAQVSRGPQGARLFFAKLTVYELTT